MTDARASSRVPAGSPATPGHHHIHHHSAAAVKSSEPVSAVSMLQNSMQVLQRMERLHLDEDCDDDLEPSRVAALVAESLGVEPQRVGDAEVSALMRQSLAVAERLAAASLMTSAAAKRRLQARSLELGGLAGLGPDLAEYVPPRALLLYLVRMGSFSSAPRVVNADSQDDGVLLDVGARPTPEAVCGWCERQLAGTPARLLARRMLAVDGCPGQGPGRPARPGTAHWASDDSSTIRVMQWNVLSQALGTNNDNFVACPEAALDWGIRRPLMLQELASVCPDIICLQEVDHFKFLESALSPLGYRGLFEPKPDSPCLYLQDNNGPDGCALFWRADRFTLLEEHRATLHVWRMPSNQVVLLAVLRHEASGRELCVATTHLKARAGALMSTMRNEQGRDLLRHVAAHADGRPVVLTGDFNAEPVEPVYRTVLQHPGLRLASAYSKASHQQGEERDGPHGDLVAASMQGEPPYTTWKVREEGEQCHTIDYVFYSRSAFSVSALSDFPTAEALGPGRTPSFQYPSDHFSLCVDLRLRDSQPELRPPGAGMAGMPRPGRCASERTK